MQKTVLMASLCALILLSSCWGEEDIVPKPKGYFRIDLPEKEYSKWDGNAPFTFDVPSYCIVDKDSGANVEPFWYNLDYRKFHAVLHLSYKPVHNNIDTLLNQSRQLAIQHQVKANAMKESPVMNDSAKVFGLLYEFGGNAASSVQFYLTDSTNHFVRGALYFWARPNADSLGPVLDYISKDVYRMVESFKWKSIQ